MRLAGKRWEHDVLRQLLEAIARGGLHVGIGIVCQDEEHRREFQRLER